MTTAPRAALLALASAVALSGCATVPVPASSAQDAFWQALSSHCGKAYAGGLVSTQEADADMRGKAMAMHVRTCSADRIEVPFHVQQADGTWDRSRTWVLTRSADGLRLKHDHRHEDGSHDAVTMYGGDTASEGTARAQDFPVDAESIALFEREGLNVSVTTAGRLEDDPPGPTQANFADTLPPPPPSDRRFRVEFDFARPIAPPPAPWGH